MSRVIRLINRGWIAIKDTYYDTDTGYMTEIALVSPRGTLFEISEKLEWWAQLMDVFVDPEDYPVGYDCFVFDPRPYGATWVEIIRLSSTG